MISINIAKEYTRTPGGRFSNEGNFSGEEFRKTWLRPKYEEAKQQNTPLEVILDGGYGYATSFLEEAFGGLARELKDPALLDIIIVSDEEPSLVDKIKNYIQDALD